IVDAGDPAFRTAYMPEHGLDDMRGHADLVHVRCDRAAEIMNDPGLHPVERSIEAHLGLGPTGETAVSRSEHERALTVGTGLQDGYCRGPEMNDMRAVVLHLCRRQCDHAATEIDFLPFEVRNLVASLAEQYQQSQDVSEVTGGEGVPNAHKLVHAQEAIAAA